MMYPSAVPMKAIVCSSSMVVIIDDTRVDGHSIIAVDVMGSSILPRARRQFAAEHFCWSANGKLSYPIWSKFCEIILRIIIIIIIIITWPWLCHGQVLYRTCFFLTSTAQGAELVLLLSTFFFFWLQPSSPTSRMQWSCYWCMLVTTGMGIQDVHSLTIAWPLTQ